MIFLKHLIKKMSIDCPTSKIHFLSPFLNPTNISEISEMVECEIKFISISPPRNKYQIFKEEETFTEGLDERKFVKANFDMITNSGITLHYMSSKEATRNAAIDSLSKTSNISRFKKMVGEWDKKKIEEFKILINEKIIKEYPGEYIVSNGIAYLHADVPTIVKLKIIKMVKMGMINYLYATNSVLNGIDLPFDNIIIEKTKIGNSNMNPSDFKNLVGRAGRFSNSKRFSNFGFTIIKKNEKNDGWWRKNKEKIRKPDHSLLTSEDNEIKTFVEESLKKYKETKNKKYLIDPRINPESLENISSKYSLEESTAIIFKILTLNKNDKEELNNEIEKVLKLYEFHKYKAKSVKNENEYKNHVINGIKNYFLFNFSVDNYIKSATKFQGFNDRNEKGKAEYLETQNFRVKTFGKFFFMMFLNHFCKVSKFNMNLDDIFEFHVFNKNIIDELNKERYSKNNEIWKIWKSLFDNNEIWKTKRGLIQIFIGEDIGGIIKILKNKRRKDVKTSNPKSVKKIIDFLEGLKTH